MSVPGQGDGNGIYVRGADGRLYFLPADMMDPVVVEERHDQGSGVSTAAPQARGGEDGASSAFYIEPGELHADRAAARGGEDSASSSAYIEPGELQADRAAARGGGDGASSAAYIDPGELGRA